MEVDGPPNSARVIWRKPSPQTGNGMSMLVRSTRRPDLQQVFRVLDHTNEAGLYKADFVLSEYVSHPCVGRVNLDAPGALCLLSVSMPYGGG